MRLVIRRQNTEIGSRIRKFNIVANIFDPLVSYQANPYFLAPSNCSQPSQINIAVCIYPVGIPNGIGLEEPAQCRRVDAGLVVIHAELGEVDLPGVLEPAGVGGRGDAVFIIGVDLRGCAIAGSAHHYRSACIGIQVSAGGGNGAAAGIFRNRVIHAPQS